MTVDPGTVRAILLQVIAAVIAALIIIWYQERRK